MKRVANCIWDRWKPVIAFQQITALAHVFIQTKDDLGENVFFIAYLSDSSFSRYFLISSSVAKSVFQEKNS